MTRPPIRSHRADDSADAAPQGLRPQSARPMLSLEGETKAPYQTEEQALR